MPSMHTIYSVLSPAYSGWNVKAIIEFRINFISQTENKLEVFCLFDPHKSQKPLKLKKSYILQYFVSAAVYHCCHKTDIWLKTTAFPQLWQATGTHRTPCSHDVDVLCQCHKAASLARIWHYLNVCSRIRVGTSAVCWVSEEGHLSECAEDPDWCRTQWEVPAVPLAATVCITVTVVSHDAGLFHRHSHQ